MFVHAMDIRYNHSTLIHVLRACPNDDATDLLAIGGEHSVDVLLVVSHTLFFFFFFLFLLALAFTLTI